MTIAQKHSLENNDAAYVLLVLIFLSISFSAFSQKEEAKIISDTTKTLTVATVHTEFERIAKEIPQMWKPYSDSVQLKSLQRELAHQAETLISIKQFADEILGGYMTFSQITNLQSKLSRSRSDFKLLSEKVSEISLDLETSILLLKRYQADWNTVLKKSTTDSLYMVFATQAQEALSSIGSTEKKLESQFTRFLRTQNDINKNLSDIAHYEEQVENAQRLNVVRLFKRDSISIWSGNRKDSLKHSQSKNTIRENFNNSTQEAYEYLTKSMSGLLLIAIFGIGFYSIMYLLRKKERNEPQHIILAEGDQLIIQNPFSSTLVIVLLITILYLKDRPILLTEIIMIAFAFPVVIFLISETRKNRWLYGIILVIYLVNVSLHYLPISLISQHVLLILLCLSTVIGLSWMHRHPSNYLTMYKGLVLDFFKTTLIPFYFYLSVLTFLLIVAGYISLSELILDGIITSIYVGPIILLCMQSAISFVSLLSRTSFLTHSKLIHQYLSLIVNLVKLGAGYLWIKTLLIAFGLSQFVANAIEGIWEFGGDFGEVHVTLGSVLTVLIIFASSFFLSNVIKVLLEEEILSRFKVARGVPMAMGVLGKYLVIVIGFFLAIAASGFDLTKMSILAGALGVGVGFGLQDLVSNFVSGMILIFERPILVGDIIEAEGLEGQVSEIGIRTSKIITYDGAEVIIPNSKLISNRVSNWTLSNRKRRFNIEVRTHTKADPGEIINVLEKVATQRIHVLKHPSPFVVFEGQREQALLFRLYYWQEGEILITRGELHVQIYLALRERGIEVTIPTYEIKNL